MDKFPTPTLDSIEKMKQSGNWKATGNETISPTSIDWKMGLFLLLGTLELIGVQLVALTKVQKDIRDKLTTSKENPAKHAESEPPKPTLEPKQTVKKTDTKNKRSARY